MNNCSLPFDDLITFYEGRQDSATEERVRLHLESGCTICQERLTWLRHFMPALHNAVTTEAVSAPEATVARARQIARERRLTPTQPPLLVHIAQLLFDSRQRISPVAVRGSAEPETQKLYATEEHYIEVWIEQMREGGYYLIGQTVSKGDKAPVRPHSVVLIAEDGSRTHASQEGNEFHLAFVNGGTYQMRLRLSAEEIVLPEVSVGI